MLIETIRTDLTTAMKAKDRVTVRTLRSVIAAVTEAEVAGDTARTLTDDEVEKVIAAEVKRRVEAAEAFDAAGRDGQAADERAEKAVLDAYLPQPLTEEELDEVIDTELAAGGWSTKADMGPAMKAITAAVAGRADGRTVADKVKSRLA